MRQPALTRKTLAELVAGVPAEDAARALRAAGLAASIVNSVADLVREPHLWARGALARVTHPDLGEIVTQGVVPTLSKTPGRVAGWSRSPGSIDGGTSWRREVRSSDPRRLAGSLGCGSTTSQDHPE